ncbi:membrane-bound lytic murein transglycosylase MltF [Gilvimarinus polysaccharolyticus]|uniref:membrane-bound lytic murein transglycosylase MltF n=1 Tax=Gilvimarinus polysaccharolyticus TaxID=863921 RepID=UPI00067343EC|nr:membrane-bound lytic murein transglycosylase MltF [Gilvimarinus polysaccharolyticus]
MLSKLGQYVRRLPKRFSIKRTLFSVLLIAVCATITSSRPPTTLEQVLTNGTLVAISRNGPTTYYEGLDGTTGFEYALLQGFADSLGVTLEIREQESLSVMLDMVAAGDAQLAAAGLTITPQRQARVHFTAPYLEVTQQLIYNRGENKPESIEDVIGGDLLLMTGSSHVERLQQLKADHPELEWREESNLEMIDLLEMVHRGEVDYAIVDSNAYHINAQTFPRARLAFDVGEPDALGWAFPQRTDTSLYDRAQAYLTDIKKSGTLDTLIAEFFSNDDPVSTGGALLFTHRLENRLPQWQELIQKVADEVGLSWQLLAAVSYQESHWDSKARSHTGVRGLMMLTRATAKELGVKNRLDPEQSMRGGATYLKSLYDRLPERIQEPDRTLLALAAYNTGMGHLEDARVLTQRHGDNADLWQDVEKYLPLLAKRKYYRTVKHGYARGWEPVHYVNNILRFRDIIVWHDQQEQRRLAMATSTEEDTDESTDEQKTRNDNGIMPMSVL